MTDGDSPTIAPAAPAPLATTGQRVRLTLRRTCDSRQTDPRYRDRTATEIGEAPAPVAPTPNGLGGDPVSCAGQDRERRGPPLSTWTGSLPTCSRSRSRNGWPEARPAPTPKDLVFTPEDGRPFDGQTDCGARRRYGAAICSVNAMQCSRAPLGVSGGRGRSGRGPVGPVHPPSGRGYPATIHLATRTGAGMRPTLKSGRRINTAAHTRSVARRTCS